jgi:hypothetical protein
VEETTVVEVGEQKGGLQQDVLAHEVYVDREPGEELHECLDHQPSFFERGKPQTFLSLWFANL